LPFPFNENTILKILLFLFARSLRSVVHQTMVVNINVQMVLVPVMLDMICLEASNALQRIVGSLR
jgi:hypothetical protein